MMKAMCILAAVCAALVVACYLLARLEIMRGIEIKRLENEIESKGAAAKKAAARRRKVSTGDNRADFDAGIELLRDASEKSKR